MSVPRTRSRSNESSISVVRSLLERNLLERAVAIAETRWAGSGPLVRLAHEWTGLSATERRQRLAAIGPEDLARLREVAEIQPDLARVLDDLEARGILPPVEGLADAPLVPGAPATQAPSLVAEPPPVAQAAPVSVADSGSPPARTPREHQRVTPLPQSTRPTLNLGLPSTSEFMEMEVERRAKVVEQTESILERIRAQLDSVPARLEAQRPRGSFLGAEPLLTTESRVVAEDPENLDAVDVQTIDSAERGMLLASQLRDSVVVEMDRFERFPTNAELDIAASELSLGIVTLTPTEMGVPAFWGRLERSGREIRTTPGAFPRALNRHNLIVVRGRLTPRAVDRLREGYCDIPGTRATVRVNPGARVLILPA